MKESVNIYYEDECLGTPKDIHKALNKAIKMVDILNKTKYKVLLESFREEVSKL